MSEPFLNFVPCPWCDGNDGDPSHQCPPEAAERREEHVREAFQRLATALHTPNDVATADQLRRKLMECEAALEAMTEASQRLVDEAVAEAVKKERERMAQAIDVVFTWWDDDYEHGQVEPFFRNGVKRACFLMRDHLTAEPEEGTRDE